MSYGSKSSKRRRILEELEIFSSAADSEVSINEISNEIQETLDFPNTEDETQNISGTLSHQYFFSALESDSNINDAYSSFDKNENTFSFNFNDITTPANIQLVNWVVKHGISNTATSDLLKILKSVENRGVKYNNKIKRGYSWKVFSLRCF
ncbi:uncharacterized protein LOC126907779 [Daktulosphaira vitifoliae]|uniref:uncharacterized protein LOC126907779 n=1 Tax=Daktulosphaira vitifoliae TaxID=58002 RepID=UPI0021AA2947|nr:uncharacterized protein LOC126907779 [Daktulosphaira vitifoliae]XP_050545331.1 uncharacterized protein LOC126907779 [Daktulosphaira vitifoliae]